MRVLVASLTLAVFFGTGAFANPVLEPETELQVGDAYLPRAVQLGTPVYWSGLSGEVDNSRPPIEWPKAIHVGADEELEVTVEGPSRPASVELSIWRTVKRNGIPSRRIAHSECFPDEPSIDGCGVRLDTTEAGYPGWAMRFDNPISSGHVYVAVAFTWDGSTTFQGAWIFHGRVHMNQ